MRRRSKQADQTPRVEQPLNVVHVASEVSPFSETGGLGVVAGALPSAVHSAGINTSVITPCYESVPADCYEDTGITVDVRVGHRTSEVSIQRGELPGGVPVYLLKCDEAFGRDGIYGPRPSADYADNAWRFGLLSEAAIAVSRRLRLHPDIFHCHDWQTGLLPLYCKQRMGRWVHSVLTVHNLGYHGTFPADTLDELGLDRMLFTPDGIEFWGWLSFLKAGLVYADKLTTVSPTYASEIQTARYGHGLDGVLRSRSEDLVGILNGIPEARPLPELPAFTASDLSGKAEHRRALCDAVGLPDDDTPLFVIVSRLVSQKGMDLVGPALAELLEAGRLRLAVLGTGDAELEASMHALAARWPGRVTVDIRYDDARARLLLSGGDALLMPSRYEPCGLTQMYALREGTLPIARATGGLADTVLDGNTGFTFDEPAADALQRAVERAVTTYTDAPETWAAMQRAAMDSDFSWPRSAAHYAELYREVFDD